MTDNKKIAEFHQAQVSIVIRISDEKENYGIRKFDLAVLLNTEEEWNKLRSRIEKAVEQIQEEIDDS